MNTERALAVEDLGRRLHADRTMLVLMPPGRLEPAAPFTAVRPLAPSQPTAALASATRTAMVVIRAMDA